MTDPLAHGGPDGGGLTDCWMCCQRKLVTQILPCTARHMMSAGFCSLHCYALESLPAGGRSFLLVQLLRKSIGAAALI